MQTHVKQIESVFDKKIKKTQKVYLDYIFIYSSIHIIHLDAQNYAIFAIIIPIRPRGNYASFPRNEMKRRLITFALPRFKL